MQADECFGHIKNLIVIADDNMVVGSKHNQRTMIW